MKKIILLFLFITFTSTFAQKVLTTNTGKIHFEASVPFYEEVAAENHSANCRLILKNGTIYAIVQMNAFRFKLALMQDHFNSNYLETDKYPNANFKGKIEGFNWNAINEYPKEFKLNGELKIHGKTNKINTSIWLKKGVNKIEMTSTIKIDSKDYAIQIPELLSMKIAETVTINCNFSLQ